MSTISPYLVGVMVRGVAPMAIQVHGLTWWDQITLASAGSPFSVVMVLIVVFMMFLFLLLVPHS